MLFFFCSCPILTHSKSRMKVVLELKCKWWKFMKLRDWENELASKPSKSEWIKTLEFRNSILIGWWKMTLLNVPICAVLLYKPTYFSLSGFHWLSTIILNRRNMWSAKLSHCVCEGKCFILVKNSVKEVGSLKKLDLSVIWYPWLQNFINEQTTVRMQWCKKYMVFCE